MNANTNLNVLGGILDAVLANLVETIDKRVEAKVFTLTERIVALEEKMGSVMNCQDNDQMDNAQRITALEEKLEAHLSEERPGTTATLDQTEEFRLAVCKIIDKHTMGDEFLDPLVDALTDNDKFNDAINSAAVEAARSEAEEAISDHCSEYDHDDIHEKSDIDEDAVKDIIKEVLNNTTVTLKI